MKRYDILPFPIVFVAALLIALILHSCG